MEKLRNKKKIDIAFFINLVLPKVIEIMIPNYNYIKPQGILGKFLEGILFL
jgi:hypothetical protein